MRKITAKEFLKLVRTDAPLPDDLFVGGSLDLIGTGITALPDGLSVDGNLFLIGTGITALPEGLHVGGNLFLRGTGITALPDDLFVGGSLYLGSTLITNVIWLDEVAGFDERRGPVLMNRGEPMVSLGCFLGNEEDAVAEIIKKYGENSKYEEIVRRAFLKFNDEFGEA